MIVSVQLSSSNSAPNLENNRHLTIPFEGGMHSFKRHGAYASQNWRYESEPPFKPSPLTCYKQFGTNSIIVLIFVESQRVHIQSIYKVCNRSVVLLNKKIHILLSQVYCVWQVVKTLTIILNNPVQCLMWGRSSDSITSSVHKSTQQFRSIKWETSWRNSHGHQSRDTKCHYSSIFWIHVLHYSQEILVFQQ